MAFDEGARDDFAAVGTCARFITGHEEVDDKTIPIYRYEVNAKAYMQKDSLRDLTVEPFATWIYNEQVFLSEETSRQMRKDMLEECERLSISRVAYDPNNSKAISQDLAHEGIEPVKFAQRSYMYSEPIKDFLSDLKRGKITHNGNPVLHWMATNAIIVKDADDKWRFDKGSSADKIDMVVAILMAYFVCKISPSRCLNLPPALF
jgi:phage terminase large subunit-like protein